MAILNKLLIVTFFASATFSAQAIEYRVEGNPDIVQMHEEGSWEKRCESFNNDCDVPAGRYQVTILDRNWNTLNQVPGVVVTDGSSGLVSADSQQQIAIPAAAEIVQYHDTRTWEKLCETTDLTNLADCVIPDGTYQVTTLDRNWNTLDQHIRVVTASHANPVGAPVDDAAQNSDEAADDEPQAESLPEEPLPPPPAPVQITGDFNGNAIADVFESSSDDADGDLIADKYDVDTVPGDDSNNNGINDKFEGQLDPSADGNNDGLIDFYAQQVKQDDPPEVSEPETVTPDPVPLAPISDDVIFVADYEYGDVNSGVDGIQAFSPPADNAITVSSNISRSGQYSINHRVRKSNQYISAGAWRAESNSISLRKSRYDQGDKVRYQFSIYLPPSWKIDDKDSIDAIWQWKRFSSRPDMFVLIRGRDIELRALRSSRSTVMKNYRVGEWIDLQFDVVHSARSNGSVKMYYKYADESKYKLANEYKGATMWADGPVDSTYLKWGLYKPDYDLSSYPNGERSIYHDDIRMIRLR